MSSQPKVSSKGQIVIPKDVRKILGLKPGDRVKLQVLHGKRVIMQPAIKPPENLFVKAGSKLVEEALRESAKRDEDKIAELLKALGVTD